MGARVVSEQFTQDGVTYKCLDFLGYPKYWASDDGKVWSMRWVGMKELSQGNVNGYRNVVFCREGKTKTFYVHTLVLLAFVGPCPEGTECCHNDGVRSNNAVVNLRWDTRRNNHNDRQKHGTTPKGQKNPGCKRTEDEIREMRRQHSEDGISCSELARTWKMDRSTVHDIIKRNIWRHI